MDKRDSSNLGDKILDSVENAINSMDFKQLNRTISDSVNDAIDEARSHMMNHTDFGKFSYTRSYRSNTREKTETYTDKERNRQPGSEAKEEKEPGYRAFQTSYKGRSETSPDRLIRPREEVIKINNNGRVAGVLFTVFGSIGLGFMSVVFLVMWIIALIARPEAWVIGGASLVLAALGVTFGLMLRGGISIGNRLKRARLYAKQAGKRLYCTIEELAPLVGKSKDFVRKDIQKMIELNVFPRAYLDEQKTCLILSEDTYKQYLETQRALKERKQEESEQALKDSSKEEKKQFSEELEQMMAAGQNYLRILKEANDAIPGEVISQKISGLEDVIRRIFESVKKHPEQVKEMERFMEYYLPTTVKLVNAYRDFDSAGTTGGNVNSAKEEIEKTLDTIQKAFERLLDDLYEDAVLDVTTDASVLQTMLKKDGFAESDFTGGK